MADCDVFVCSRVVVMTDMNLIRDTFIRNISAAGRPFVDTWATTFKIFEPTFPKLGSLTGNLLDSEIIIVLVIIMILLD